MNIRPVSEWTLYHHRYGIAYALVALMVTILLTLMWADAPPGLSAHEAQSVISSHAISLTELPVTIVDLPYHLLQKASVWWLGVTPVGVRLPSLVCAVGAAVCLALLMRRWFRHNIAVLAAIVALGSTWFLSLARLGTPSIMIVFWTSLILLAATYISQQTKHWRWWKVIFAFAVALSLYTPFMVYLFAAALVASILQPHLRYLINEGSKYHITIGTALFVMILVPIGWGLFKDISQLSTLLAIPAQLPGPFEFAKNIWVALSNFGNPYTHEIGEMILPLLSLPMLAFLIAGGLRILHQSHSVRAYVLLIWAALLVPIVGLNPSNLTVLLVPSMLVATIGVGLLITYWYKLFPLNPYARFFGIIPLAALMFVIVTFNYQRYFYGMLYSPQAITVFNQDAFLAQRQVHDLKEPAPLTIVVPEQDAPLYQIIAESRPSTTVASGVDPAIIVGTQLVAESQVGPYNAMQPLPIADKLLVTDHAESALRFRLYVP